MNQNVFAKNRVESIDVLRGIVMIIMALDHVRDFFHVGAFQADPLDPATTSPMLYFTRWITHLCAPTFVFLAGTSSYLVGLRKSKAELSSFLIKRGVWLILVEVLVVTLALSFNPLYNFLFLQVIWAIGISMVMLGLLVRLPYAAIFTIGLVIVFGHNLLDYPEAAHAAHKQPLGFLWDLVHGARFAIYSYAPNRVLAIIYPFLPWTGLMLLGYSAGKLFTAEFPAARRKKILVYLGFGAIALFFLLRGINLYGDPVRWVKQDTLLKNLFAFFNVNKYPPSLMYMSITIGVSLLILRLLEGVRNPITEFSKVFGRVPFFYYVVHFFLIHTLTVIAFYMSGYKSGDIVSNQVPFLFRPVEFGYSLWGVYLIWAAIIAFLYPLCRKYNNYKSTHQKWWLSYI
ncbi:heparan-alpha-glucosaminide N-acetyltransferase domain-containing protein [Paraflavitalea sp. CAU 1676]|uniref:DUF1624 domain-containing protein n=1 Tax=Paraflavitalea sp. CAU 1676 TaxID=3032598 RepID=UPI0023DC4FEB|nr:heparan-alpha-glucosaminide N-acetyltransferase domain-containing protein [Paraflavitalea sp. CAU 1676]MDF2190126.1 heparan-alpha-glucosaminide N-acetyltransferase domain-containing protein [Paraflavitalea sp. CAU 1676]